MFSFWTKALDRQVIKMAAARFQQRRECPNRAAEAEALGSSPDFFCDFVIAPADLSFSSAHDFQFRSAIATAYPENNIVHGKLYRAGSDWERKPTVVLLHGWSGERLYYYEFPWLAWRLGRSGMNTAMLELPYHGQRKPQTQGALRNFIAPDLFHMIQATQQGIADIRALLAWLQSQGSPRVGLWGFSMGGWLAGLVTCHEPKTNFSVLMSPLVDLRQAIEDLEFCEPIRQGIDGVDLNLERLNLSEFKPLPSPDKILIIECLHDQFVPAASIEAVWQRWNQPNIWRVGHGHISVLLSLPVMERTVRWVEQKAL